MRTKKTIVPLCVPRGGSSMVAGLLRILGIDMGDKIKSDKHEDLDILWKPTEHIIKVIQDYNQRKLVWGFKTPWIGNHIHQIYPHLINPQFIVINRNFDDVVNSTVNRNPNATKQGAAERTSMLNAKLNDFMLKYPNHNYLHLDYDKCLQDKEGTVRALADFIGIKLDKDKLEKCKKFMSKGYKTLDETTLTKMAFVETYFDNKNLDELKTTITPNWSTENIDYHLELLKLKDVPRTLEIGCGIGRIIGKRHPDLQRIVLRYGNIRNYRGGYW